MEIEKQLEIIKKGTVEIIEENDLMQRLKSGRKLRVKWGADPSAPDLHLGHVVVLRKLKQLQDLGHKIIFLIGDFTAMIGDPSGRSTTRPALSKNEVLKNAKTYKDQIFKILDKEKTEVVYNCRWLDKLSLFEIINLVGKQTVSQMLERDDFHKRFQEEKPIGMHEFIYPILQGFDSVELKADLEVGGSDQKFNLLMGREIQNQFGQKPQIILTLPLLEGTDGMAKMSKSLNNHIGITEPAQEIFGKIMSIPDELMWKYYELLTDVDDKEMQRQTQSGSLNPKDAKIKLAETIVTQFYSLKKAQESKAAFEKIFSKKELPEEITQININDLQLENENRINLAKLINQLKLTPSITEARRMIRQGAVKINQEKILDEKLVFKVEKDMVISVGKRKFVKLI